MFPLDLVLLPGAALPLHIFEPRYREMIGECLEFKRAFGVVRARELPEQREQEETRIESPRMADIGCTAEIISVVNKYPDGRMNIVTRGLQRFEILEINRSRPFLQADVLYLQDTPGSPLPDKITRAVALQGEILTLAGAQAEGSTSVRDGLLSFHLASSLPLDLDFKQRLLEISSESERIEALISFFEAVLPNLRRATHVRKKAGGNGHAL